MYIYYPSCNFRKMLPDVEKAFQKYLKEQYQMKIAGCCLYTYKLLGENTALINCQACRENLNSFLEEPDIKSIWEFIDADSSFVFPDYNHQKMQLVDCYRDRHQKEEHEAIRSILNKMNIDVVELEYNKENANFCGIKHYEPVSKENIQLLSEQKEDKLSHMSKEVQTALMKEYAEQLIYPAITYCNTCTQGIELAEKEVHHLLELLMRDKV